MNEIETAAEIKLLPAAYRQETAHFTNFMPLAYWIACERFSRWSRTMISPMCYWHMLKRKPPWIHEVVEDAFARAKVRIVPSIQVGNAYISDKLPVEEFREALEEALRPLVAMAEAAWRAEKGERRADETFRWRADAQLLRSLRLLQGDAGELRVVIPQAVVDGVIGGEGAGHGPGDAGGVEDEANAPGFSGQAMISPACGSEGCRRL
jgi:hypothetical protein